MTLNVGDVATLTYALTVAGTPTSATVVLTVTAPDGTTSTPSVVESPTGTYTAEPIITMAGTWSYRWVASGAATDVETGSFTVRAATTPDDVTPDDVADLLAQRVLTQDGNPGGTFDSTTVPTAEQVTRLITQIRAEETGGLGTIPTTLTAMLNSLVALAAAVRVLGVYFSGDAARDDLDADLSNLRERFREAVDTINTTGDPDAVSAGGSGDGERQPPPVWSFPTTRAGWVSPYGIPVTTLNEPY